MANGLWGCLGPVMWVNYFLQTNQWNLINILMHLMKWTWTRQYRYKIYCSYQKYWLKNNLFISGHNTNQANNKWILDTHSSQITGMIKVMMIFTPTIIFTLISAHRKKAIRISCHVFYVSFCLGNKVNLYLSLLPNVNLKRAIQIIINLHYDEYTLC